MLAIDEKYFPGFRQEMIDVGEGIKINTFIGGNGHEAILMLHGHMEKHIEEHTIKDCWHSVTEKKPGQFLG